MATLRQALFSANTLLKNGIATVKGGDVVIAPTARATGGWQNTGTINALTGHDILSSTGVFAPLADVATYGGATVITAGVTSSLLYNAAIANAGSGTIDMGSGKDTLSGTTSGLRSIGILNGKVGSKVATSASLIMGTDDDQIVGVNASGTHANTFGIYNTGIIDLGSGNDSIQGIKSSTSPTGAAIYNIGTIVGGTGNDTFDAFQGGWAGTGTVDCGVGDDAVMGFGSGTFNGGAGLGDELILPAGKYTVAYNEIPTPTTSDFRLTRSGDKGVVMNCIGFETIVSADLLAVISVTAVDGTRPTGFTVDDQGFFSGVTLVAATSAL
jgi:hypothetical protein